MKIGILTFQQTQIPLKNLHNYGGILQAFALQEIVKKILPDHEVEIIDYAPKIDLEDKNYYSDLKKSNTLQSKLKNFVHLTLLLPKVLRRRKKVQDFLNRYYSLSKRKYRSFEADFNYDIYIFGSDQIWNNSITKEFDNVFWGDFTTKENSLKITYAVSSGLRQIEDSDVKYITSRLQSFDSLSFREIGLKELLKNYTDKEIYHVLDPTLVADIDLWNSVLVTPKIRKKYLLTYLLNANNEILDFACETATKLGLELITITYNNHIFSSSNVYQTIGPDEFVGLFKSAEYVLTNSFHGLSFSIIFNRPFLIFLYNNSRDERPLSLLKTLHIEERAIYKTIDALTVLNKEINWSEVNEKHTIEKKKSKSYLEIALLK